MRAWIEEERLYFSELFSILSKRTAPRRCNGLHAHRDVYGIKVSTIQIDWHFLKQAELFLSHIEPPSTFWLLSLLLSVTIDCVINLDSSPRNIFLIFFLDLSQSEGNVGEC